MYVCLSSLHATTSGTTSLANEKLHNCWLLLLLLLVRWLAGWYPLSAPTHCRATRSKRSITVVSLASSSTRWKLSACVFIHNTTARARHSIKQHKSFCWDQNHATNSTPHQYTALMTTTTQNEPKKKEMKCFIPGTPTGVARKKGGKLAGKSHINPPPTAFE